MSLEHLPREAMAEINPFQPVPPDSIRRVSADLYEFLRQMTATLRTQHNLIQAGDSTFDWQVMLRVDESAEYTLGSMGRFVHPTYGLIQGRYVKFTGMNSSEPTIVGFERGIGGLSWQVTNVLTQAQDERPIGVVAAFDLPANGRFGWIVTHGVNLSAIDLSVKPSTGDLVRWGDSVFGQFLGSGVEANGFLWRVPAGSVRVDAASVASAEGTPGNSTGTDGSVTRGEFEETLEKRFAKQNSNSSMFLSILSQQLARLTDSTAGLTLTETLQTIVNWKNLASTAAETASQAGRDAELAASATSQNYRDVVAYRDEASFYSVSAGEFYNQASISATESSVAAGQAAEASLTAEGYAAQAREYVSLTARVGNDILLNPSFSDPTWKPSENPIPPKWTRQAGPPTGFVQYSPGYYGPYALEMRRPQNNSNMGIYQIVNIQTRGNYLLGADVQLVSGTWNRTGLVVEAFSAADGTGTLLDTILYNFQSEATIDGQVNPTDPGFYTWSKAITLPNATNSIRVYAMASKSTLSGSAPEAATTRWHTVSLRRPNFSDSSGSAAYTDSRIAEVNSALATETQARADLSTSVDTRFQGVSNSLASYDSQISAAVSDSQSAISQVTTLQSTVDDQQVTVQQISQAFNGVSGRYAVTVDADGSITGYELIGGGGQSAFNIRADTFTIKSSDGTKTPFAVDSTTGLVTITSDVRINGQLILDETIDTPQLAPTAFQKVISTLKVSTQFIQLDAGKTQVLQLTPGNIQSEVERLRVEGTIMVFTVGGQLRGNLSVEVARISGGVEGVERTTNYPVGHDGSGYADLVPIDIDLIPQYNVAYRVTVFYTPMAIDDPLDTNPTQILQMSSLRTVVFRR